VREHVPARIGRPAGSARECVAIGGAGAPAQEVQIEDIACRCGGGNGQVGVEPRQCGRLLGVEVGCRIIAE